MIDGGAQQRAEILRGVGQSRVRADGDALHALRAVFRDEVRSFAAGNILGGGVACGGGDEADGGERRGGLVIAEVRAELCIEAGEGGQRSARGLSVRDCVERHPVPHAEPSAAGTVSRIGSSAWPRRDEWSAAASAPIAISVTWP